MAYAQAMDEWETVFTHRPCTACNGIAKRCNGMCNGSSGYILQRRNPAEVERIKAKRERLREEAEWIIARRRCGEPAGKSLDELKP
jgi:hypothetical protein